MFASSFKVLNDYKFVLIITIILFIIPFFWLAPGEMDLGGDDNRLYFYDSLEYLKNTALYSFQMEGMGTVESRYYEIPYILLITVLKLFFSSPTIVINFINGLKLSLAFIAMYLLIHEFIKQMYSEKKYIQIVGVLSGIFYITSLGSVHLSSEWNRPLASHNQIFLNPLVFYLLFKFIQTDRYLYLWITLLITFVFSINFSYSAISPFFAFYPLAFLFLILYTKFFIKKKIPWKGIGLGLLLFIGIHAFHLFNQIASLFDTSSHLSIGTSVFKKSTVEPSGAEYFSAIAPSGMASLNFFIPSQNGLFRWASPLSLIFIIIGLLLNKKKIVFFVFIFFFLTFFLATANITNSGFSFYKSLFYLPLFSMFRVFFMKWMYVFLFFYSLLFAFALYNMFLKLKIFYVKLISLFIFLILLIVGIPIFSGELTNKNIIRGSNNLKTIMIMDPTFEQTLQYMRKLPNDGKFINFPLSDFDNQLILGKNGGAYEGPPILRHLTTKFGFFGDRNFGWQDTDPVKYTQLIKKYAREKNYNKLLSIFSTLNIRYIFHNSDPRIYEENFTRFEGPYAYIKSSLPKTQAEYKEFIHNFPVRKIYSNGPYVIYEIDKSLSNPTIFIPENIYQSDSLSFDSSKRHKVFISKEICTKRAVSNICNGKYKKSDIDLKFRMINPTLYKVDVIKGKNTDNLLLVMQHAFSSNWKLIINDKFLSEDKHIPVNGYANGWLLTETEVPDEKKITLYIKLAQQIFFLYGWIITIISFIVATILLVVSYISKK